MAAPPMVELIYQTDAYCRAFPAMVVAADAEGVVLDRTAFYPGGGGQPADQGWLIASDGSGRRWPVVGMARAEAGPRHLLAPREEPPAPGTPVSGELDWARRYRLMRTHTALHVLCGVVFRDYAALVTGGSMDVDKARMDFELDAFGPELAAEIERRANAEIAAGREVRVRILPRDEAFAIPDLIRTKVNLLPPGIEQVRIVEVVGLDLQADGGTHVANTREVGGLRVVGTRSKGKSNKRLEIVLIDPTDDSAG